MRLVIAGGGTGGHLFPGIAIAEALVDHDPQSEVLFIGTAKGIETREVPKAGFPLELIEVGGLKRVGLRKTLKTLWALPASLWHSLRLLRRFNAGAVIGVGGYASGPVLLAAAILRIPTAICEQNSAAGFTNRVLAQFVRRVYLTFDGARGYFPAAKTQLVGNPLRRSFRRAVSQGARAPVSGRIFTFGGSQGARILNEVVPQALRHLQERGLSVSALHQAGASEIEEVRASYAAGKVEARVVSFIDDMVGEYRHAEIVVCRAGASSCTELTALGIPAILVPFPFAADDHQTSNARDLADRGAALLLPQAELTAVRLADELEALLREPARRSAIEESARAMGRRDAAETIVQEALMGFRSKQQGGFMTDSPAGAPR